MDLEIFRTENGVDTWDYQKNTCRCHPESCNCDDWAVLRNGKKVFTVFDRSIAKMIVQRLQTSEDLAQLTYDYATGKTDGDEIVVYVRQAME